MAAISVDGTDDSGSAFRGAERFLLTRPVEHNLILSLLHQRLTHPEPGRYWTVRDGEDVIGFGLQSPRRFSAGVTPMARSAVEALVDAMASEPDTHLPGVIADAGTAAAFAGRWSELVPDRVTPREGQRIYRLGVLRPTATVAGSFRPAIDDEQDLLVAWREAMETETDSRGAGDPAACVQNDLDDGRLFVWDDSGPVSMARASIPVAGVSRIGVVFSPPHLRRRGYATACVGALCSWVQQNEQADCMLYTQLANPTSNAIYRRLGFVAVAEVLRYQFERRPGD